MPARGLISPGSGLRPSPYALLVKRRPHSTQHSRAASAAKVRRKPEDHGPLFLLNREASRALDRLAHDEFGIPSIVLMENASRHVADVALDALEDVDDPSITVVCGPGHNGGDGLAAARHLSNAGVRVTIALAADPARLAGDAAAHLGIVRRMGLPIREIAPGAASPDVFSGSHLIIDALLGTGLDRPVQAALAEMILAVNAARAAGALVLAVDLPSGLDADSGKVLGAAVHADLTVTFCGLKPCFLSIEGQALVGEVVVADIGAPRVLIERLGKRLPPLGTGRRLAELRGHMRPPPPPRRRRKPGP